MKRELTIKLSLPSSKAIIVGLFLLVSYLLVYLIVNSYAETNSLPHRNLLSPGGWFVTNVATPTPIPDTILKLDKNQMLMAINSYRIKKQLEPFSEYAYLCTIAKEVISKTVEDNFLAYKENKVNSIVKEISEKYPYSNPVYAIYGASVLENKPWDWWRPQYLWEIPKLVNSIYAEHQDFILTKKAKQVCIDSHLSKQGDMYIIISSDYKK